MLNYTAALNLKLRKYLGRTKIAFRKINPQHHKFWLSNSWCKCKKPQNNTIIHQPLQGIWLHTQRKDGTNTSHLQPPPKKPSMPNKNTKVKIHSPDGDTDYFDIVTSVLQGDTLAPNLFIIIICPDYVLRTSIDLMKEKFQAGKGKKLKIPHTNYYWHGLHRWHNASNKFTHLSWIAWNKQQVAKVFLSTLTKQNTCALIKVLTSPH